MQPRPVIAIVENTKKDVGTLFATILGLAVLIFGATGGFLSAADLLLNEIWGVKQNPKADFWENHQGLGFEPGI